MGYTQESGRIHAGAAIHAYAKYKKLSAKAMRFVVLAVSEESRPRWTAFVLSTAWLTISWSDRDGEDVYTSLPTLEQALGSVPRETPCFESHSTKHRLLGLHTP